MTSKPSHFCIILFNADLNPRIVACTFYQAYTRDKKYQAYNTIYRYNLYALFSRAGVYKCICRINKPNNTQDGKDGAKNSFKVHNVFYFISFASKFCFIYKMCFYFDKTLTINVTIFQKSSEQYPCNYQ